MRIIGVLSVFLFLISCTEKNVIKSNRSMVKNGFNNESLDLVNGQIVDNSVLPSAVYINPISSSGWAYHCSGSFISKRTILTAAHCIENAVRVEYQSEDNERHSSDHISIHPMYQRSEEGTPEFDIALIHFPQDLAPDVAEIETELPVWNDKIEMIGYGLNSFIDGVSVDGKRRWGTNYISIIPMFSDFISGVQINLTTERQSLYPKFGWEGIEYNDQGVDAIPYLGDSGGPVYKNGKLIGVISHLTFDKQDSYTSDIGNPTLNEDPEIDGAPTRIEAFYAMDVSDSRIRTFIEDTLNGVEPSSSLEKIKYYYGDQLTATLKPGELTLNQGESLVTKDRKLIVQHDGNVVIYNLNTNEALWDSGTTGEEEVSFKFQEDGNLVLYSKSEPLWSSQTQRKGECLIFGSVLNLSDENILISGNLAIKKKGLQIKYDFSGSASVQIRPGDLELHQGEALVTNSRMLVMQDDGNLVIYDTRNDSPTWSSETSGRENTSLYFQTDGDLVLYSGIDVIWKSDTSGRGEIIHFGSELNLSGKNILISAELAIEEKAPVDISSAVFVSFDPGEVVLYQGESIETPTVMLILQDDGNLVVYDKMSGDPIWSSGTVTNKESVLIFQDDGNLVLYAESKPEWSSKTEGRGDKLFFGSDEGSTPNRLQIAKYFSIKLKN